MAPSPTRSTVYSAALTTLAALFIYYLTLAPDLTWANYGADGAELITAVVTHGGPHPPGYPLYLLLGRLFYHLPLEPVAYRFNLLSAVCLALAAGFVALTARQSPPDERGTSGAAAIALGLTFAFAPLVWSQAIISEVYALALLLLAAFLYTLFTRRLTLLSGLLLGLSATAHATAWLMLPLALAFKPRRAWPLLLAGLLLGLLPFAALPWLIRESSPVVWGDPTTLAGWWWLVSGQLYRGYLFALPPEEWARRLAAWGPVLLSQFTWAGLPLIVAGLVRLPRPERRGAYWLGGTAVAYLLFAFFYAAPDAIINSLPAWLLLSLLLRPAYHKLNHLALFLPLILLLIHFNGQTLQTDQQVRERAEALLPAIPRAAIVETSGDATIFALWYFQHVEGQRPDLILVDRELLAYDWYRVRLARLYPDLAALDQPDAAVFQTANRGKRPYCQVSLAPPQATPYTWWCLEEENL
jgi:MFS family permease